MPVLEFECTVEWSLGEGDGPTIPVEDLATELGGYVLEVKAPVMEITEDAPHGQYVEFGTHPASPHSGDGTDRVKRKFIHWAKVKLGEDEYYAMRIYRYIMKYGMRPQPHFRPGINLIWEGVEEDFLDTEGNTLETMAEMMAAKIRQILMDNNISGNTAPTDPECTESLYDTVEVRRLEGYVDDGSRDPYSDRKWEWTEYDIQRAPYRYRRGTYP